MLELKRGAAPEFRQEQGNTDLRKQNNAATAQPLAFLVFLSIHLLCSKSRHIFFFSCYIVGITRDKSFGKLAPLGGYLLMAGWLTFAF